MRETVHAEPRSRAEVNGTRPAPSGPPLEPPAPEEPVLVRTEGPGSLADRVLRPRTLISFGLAAAILFFFLRREIDPAAIWQEARQANPWVYSLAFGVWYGGFFLRAARWRRMLARVDVDPAHGYPVPGMLGLVEMYLLSWFANCIVPAKLGDAYRSYLLKQRTRASFSTGLGTILAERLTDLVMLFLTMTAAAVIVFGGHIPSEATQTFLLGLGLLAVAAVGLFVMWVSRHALERRLPARLQEQYARLHDAVFRCLRRPWLFLLLSLGVWLGEGLRLWLVANALDAGLSPATALFIALMGSLLTTIPITPAGLGVVEVVMLAVLTRVIGMETAVAGSIIFLDRVVAYWSLVAVGLVLYLRRVKSSPGALPAPGSGDPF